MNIPEDTLIVVADGERAALFENTKNNDIKLKSLGDMSFEGLEDKGPSILPPDMPQQEIGEATTAKHIADRLYCKVHKGEIENLVLVADPDTLGEIRPNLHDEVKDVLIAEIAKTLTNSTVEGIEENLKQHA